MNTDKAIVELLKIVNSLREKYPHKRFTLDGRLVGDLGEIIVEENYNLKLFDRVVEKYDAISTDGRKEQIKATFNDYLGFPCEESFVPEMYIGIKIKTDGTFEEIYNGPGNNIWEIIKSNKVPKNNLYSISINRLIKLNKLVNNTDRIGRRKE